MEEKRGFGKLSLEIISDFNKWILLTVLNAKFLVVLIAPLKKKNPFMPDFPLLN